MGNDLSSGNINFEQDPHPSDNIATYLCNAPGPGQCDYQKRDLEWILDEFNHEEKFKVVYTYVVEGVEHKSEHVIRHEKVFCFVQNLLQRPADVRQKNGSPLPNADLWRHYRKNWRDYKYFPYTVELYHFLDAHCVR